jgi:hypothetical protein
MTALASRSSHVRRGGGGVRARRMGPAPAAFARSEPALPGRRALLSRRAGRGLGSAGGCLRARAAVPCRRNPGVLVPARRLCLVPPPTSGSAPRPTTPLPSSPTARPGSVPQLQAHAAAAGLPLRAGQGGARGPGARSSRREGTGVAY